MTLKQLRAFLAAVAHGSFSGAARELGTAQATVSELVRSLEDEYASPVFTRVARGLVPTAAGQALLPHAERAVAAADAGEQTLRRIRSLDGGVATFGLLRNAHYYLLSDLAEAFQERYPEVRMRLVGLNSVDVAAEVRAGTVEAGLAVLPVPGDGLEVTPLVRDEVLFATSDPARAARPVEVDVLTERRLILFDAHYGWDDPTRRQLVDRAQQAGLTLTPWIEVEHVESALALVGRGVGETIVPRAVARSSACPPTVHTVGFTTPLHDTIALVRRENATLSPATRELARMAQQMLAT